MSQDLRETKTVEAPLDYWAMVLDFIPPVLRAWKLILAGVIVAGIGAYISAAPGPRLYNGIVYVGPFDEPAGRYTESVIRSAPVLTAVLDKFPDFPAPGLSPSRRRDILDGRIRFATAKGSDPKRPSIYILEVEDTDGARAQALVASLIEAWIPATKPQPDNLAKLTRMLEATEAQTVDLNAVIANIIKQPEILIPKTGYLPPDVASMIKARTESIFKAEELKAAIAGTSRDSILSSPTTSDSSRAMPKNRSPLVAMGIALLVLIMIALLAHALRLMASSPIYGPKLRQIRDALPKWGWRST